MLPEGFSWSLSVWTFIPWNSSNRYIATEGYKLWYLFIMNLTRSYAAKFNSTKLLSKSFQRRKMFCKSSLFVTDYWLPLYLLIAIFHSWADSLYSCHVKFWLTDCILILFLMACSFFKYSLKWCTDSAIWCPFYNTMAGATWNCCHLSTSSVRTIQPCTSFQCYFIQNHMAI